MSHQAGNSYEAALAICDKTKFESRIKNIHPQGFRKGEWATIMGLTRVIARGRLTLCYKRVFEDGFEDLVALADQCNFEISIKPVGGKKFEPFHCWIDEAND